MPGAQRSRPKQWFKALLEPIIPSRSKSTDPPKIRLGSLEEAAASSPALTDIPCEPEAPTAHQPNIGQGPLVEAVDPLPALTIIPCESEAPTLESQTSHLDSQYLPVPNPLKTTLPPMNPPGPRSAMSSGPAQGVNMIRRPEQLNKLKGILSKKLEKKEYEDSLQDPDLVPQKIAESLAKELKAKVETPGVEEKKKQKLERILVFLQGVANDGGVSVQQNMCLDVAAVSWEAFRRILQVATNHMETRHIVETAEEAIVTALDACKLWEDMYKPSPHEAIPNIPELENAIIGLYAAVIILCIKSKKHLEGPRIAKSAKNTFTGANTELQNLIREVEAKRKHLREIADIANIKGTRSSFSQILDGMAKTTSENEMKDLRESRIWLGGLEDSDLECGKLKEARASGTGEWVLRDKVFKDWMGFHKPTLLITGIPGAGKSVLLAFILEKLRYPSPGSQTSTPPVLLYFFFKNGDPETESPITMLATLVDQFITQHKTPEAVHILNSTKTKSNSLSCGSFNQLWDLFIRLVKAYAYNENKGPVTVLVDALDECAYCDDRSKLLKYIGSKDIEYDWAKLGVRFVVTSRPEVDIMNAVEPGDSESGSRCLEISLNNEHVKDDIIRFVQDQITTDKYERLRQFKQQILEVLPEKAEGMFRYAALMLDQLLKPGRAGVQKMLDSIPAGLNRMYVYILEHLSEDPEDLQLRKIVFIWVALAFRPISVNEMALAYASYDDDDDDDDDDGGGRGDSNSPPDEEFDPTRKILINEQDILKACGPLMEITSHGTLAFTHFSVKEFLMVNDLKEKRKNTPYTSSRKSDLVTKCLIRDLGIAHGFILKACMKQLLSVTFLKGQATKYYKAYSITNWILHVAQKDVQRLHSTAAQDSKTAADPWPAVLRFLSNTSTNFTEWIEIIPMHESSLKGTCLGFNNYLDGKLVRPLHVMACFGLYIPLIQTMEDINLGNDLDALDSFGISPLIWATRRGHVEVVKLFLEKGADIEARDSGNQTPLSWAAEYGHAEVVKLLHEQHADIEAKGEIGRTPLHLAAQGGHAEVVKLLHEQHADIEAKDIIGRTPLHLAVESGRAEVLKLLHEQHADMEAKDSNGQTPLSLAIDSVSYFGYSDIVVLLLKQNAHIETRGSDGKTSLSAAVIYEHLEVVQLLLGKNADIETKDESGQTPLSLAIDGALEGSDTNIEMIELFLKQNAYIETRGKDGKTSLSIAVIYEHLEMVKLLLGKNADIETKDENGQTPLSLAIDGALEGSDTNIEMIELFLKQNAYIETRGKDGKTSLSVAAIYGHLEIVKMLLGKNADIETKDENGQTPLSLAAGSGSAKMVKFLLEKNADIETKNKNSKTPLSLAAGNGHAKIAKLLLEHNADIETKDENSWTPLSLAARNGHAEMGELLLKHNADIETRDKNSWTPLSLAARYSHVEMVKLLLEHNADIETKDKNSWTPLSFAAERGHADAVELFLEKNADIETKTENSKTPLSLAARNGHAEVVKLLLEHNADIEAKDENSWTPLSLAARYGHAEVVELLLKKNADIETMDKNGQTPLSLAAKSIFAEIVELLLKYNADIETKDKNSWTPLSFAAECGHAGAVELFLEKNADIETKNKNGKTPLALAARYGHDKVVKLLLKHNANIEAKDENGETPLSLAAGSGHAKVVKLLLGKNADIEIKTQDGWTPLSLAARYHYTEVVKLLLENNADIEIKTEDSWRLLSSAARYGHAEVVKLLLAKSIDIEIKTEDGWTPLSLAASYGHAEVVKLLLEKNADIEIKTKYGWTPLSLAARYNHAEVAKLLLAKNANIEAKTKDGRTPLSLAAGNGCAEVVKLLLEHNADIETRNENGWTPLSLAVRYEHPEVVRLLLQWNADIEAKNENGQTPLSLAAEYEYVGVVELLLQKKANIETKDEDGSGDEYDWGGGYNSKDEDGSGDEDGWGVAYDRGSEYDE